jgi:N-glycosylase/DNA lyase
MPGRQVLELTIDQPLCLGDTLACGQGHRWLDRGDEWHETVVGADLMSIRQTAAGLEFTGASDEEAAGHWLHRHFRLDDDVEGIHRELAQRDRFIAGLLERHAGVRVMRVDPWECLVFFILSANNNIPRIQRDMERISEAFGQPAGGGRSTFPGPGVLGPESALVGLDELSLGLAKGKKISWAAAELESGRLDLELLVREPLMIC